MKTLKVLEKTEGSVSFSFSNNVSKIIESFKIYRIMENIHGINKWSFIVTILSYFVIVVGIAFDSKAWIIFIVLGGLLTTIVLGFIQTVLALVHLCYWKQLGFTSKKLVFIYWTIYVIYFSLYLILDLEIFTIPWLVFYFPIPMGIASYFLFVTSGIHKSKINTRILTVR